MHIGGEDILGEGRGELALDRQRPVPLVFVVHQAAAWRAGTAGGGSLADRPLGEVSPRPEPPGQKTGTPPRR